MDILAISRGNIPEAFLRGCGLQDWEIELAKLYRSDLTPGEASDLFYYKIFPSRTPKHIQFYSCFISYSHDDQRFARKLHDRLRCEGSRCWLDEHQMFPGDNIYDQVDRGIRLWDKVLLCCSRNSLARSWWVNSEIDKAFAKERDKKVLALIPLDLDGFIFTDQWESGKKSVVLERLAGDFTGWENDQCKFDTQIERLVKALRPDDAGREPPPRSLL